MAVKKGGDPVELFGTLALFVLLALVWALIVYASRTGRLEEIPYNLKYTIGLLLVVITFLSVATAFTLLALVRP